MELTQKHSEVQKLVLTTQCSEEETKIDPTIHANFTMCHASFHASLHAPTRLQVSFHQCPVAAMQNFRGVSSVTPQDDEAAFRKMDVQGTGLVDMYELADALRVMGKSERDVQQLLDELDLEQRKELVTPSPQPHIHNVDVPAVAQFFTPNSRPQFHAKIFAIHATFDATFHATPKRTTQFAALPPPSLTSAHKHMST